MAWIITIEVPDEDGRHLASAVGAAQGWLANSVFDIQEVEK